MKVCRGGGDQVNALLEGESLKNESIWGRLPICVKRKGRRRWTNGRRRGGDGGTSQESIRQKRKKGGSALFGLKTNPRGSQWRRRQCHEAYLSSRLKGTCTRILYGSARALCTVFNYFLSANS